MFIIFLCCDFIGDTRLGLMRTCLTLHNRPQSCYTSELNSPWLFTLIAIFAGCICLTITIVLMIASHWDRSVAPYAKWIGFSAGTHKSEQLYRFLSSCRYFISNTGKIIYLLHSIWNSILLILFQWYCFVWRQLYFQSDFRWTKLAELHISFQTAPKLDYHISSLWWHCG